MIHFSRIGTRECLRFWCLLLLFAFGVSAGGIVQGSGAHDAGFVASLHSITRDELLTHEAILASDELEGREAGTPGNEMAAQYIVSALEHYGLRPAGSEGFYQPFGDGFHNVIGELPGSDPSRRSEYIILGAHYDHVGYGTRRNVRDQPGQVHNGADDNASGTCALLEIAQACTLLPQSPRRSLLFVFFDAEEKGLLGSKHWVAHPTRPLEQLKLMVNMDMIGRLRMDRVEVYGWRSAPGLRPIVSRANRAYGFDLEFSWMNRSDSDHAPFFWRSIPVLLFHTGLHEDYHKASDDVDKLNLEGMECIARWVFQMTYDLANADNLPCFRSGVTEESETRRREILESPPNWRNRLGLSVERYPLPGNDVTPVVLRVSKVLFDSPAAKAGIEPGDWILAVNGQPITEVEDFLTATLLTSHREIRLTLRSHHGEDPPIEKTVTVEGPPIKLGVQWMKDEAVPNAVMITHVLKGTPADWAGLEPGDYIYSVNGDPVDPDRFEEMIQEATLSMTLEVDHRGRIRVIQVPPAGAKTTSLMPGLDHVLGVRATETAISNFYPGKRASQFTTLYCDGTSNVALSP
jgi:hypothetical protein